MGQFQRVIRGCLSYCHRCYKRGRLSFELELQAHSEEENERHSEMLNTLNNLRQIEIMAPAELL